MRHKETYLSEIDYIQYVYKNDGPFLISSPIKSKVFKFKDGSDISSKNDVMIAGLWIISNNTNLLIKAIKDDPWVIVNDSVIQFCLISLQYHSQFGTQALSKKANEIIQLAKIPAFIPKAPKRKINNQELLLYDYFPQLLRNDVESYKSKIKPFLKNHYTDKHQRKNDIKKAFKEIFRKVMPDSFVEGEKGKHTTDIALIFLAYELNIKSTSKLLPGYQKLRDMYYGQSKMKKSEVPIYRPFFGA